MKSSGISPFSKMTSDPPYQSKMTPITTPKLSVIGAPITESFGVVIGVILLWYGGSEVILEKGLIPEDFIRFILILFAILGPIKQMSNVNLKIQAGAASAERVQQMQRQPEF